MVFRFESINSTGAAMSEAINRYSTAKGFFQSSIMIFRSPERNSPSREVLTILSINMLQGFAIELYFKAWLLAANYSSKSVRAYGHKVEKLYADAKKEGLPSTPFLDDLVAALSKGHEDYTFRYIDEGDTIANVHWERAFKVLDDLDTVVDAKIGASASHGLTPGH